MKYVLLNHITAHTGHDAAHLRLPPAWARDLAAAARAARDMGVQLIVATPASNTAGSPTCIEIVPDEVGFEHIALPRYDSARSFLHERRALSSTLASLIQTADVVQLDLGGHPVPLGLIADPIARALGKPRLWIYGDEKLSERRLAARSRHAAKRLAGRALETRMRRMLGEALACPEALVTDTPRAAADLASRWHADATVIESVNVIDSEVASDASIAERHRQLLNSSRPLRLLMPGDLQIDRGTEHVLAAMHRCWRLRVPVTLTASTRGGEAAAVKRHARVLGLENALTLSDSFGPSDADLVIDPALSNTARIDLEHYAAQGVPAIAYSPRRVMPGVISVERGSVDDLAEALLRAASDRASIASRMIRGHAWVRARTIDAAHRERFRLVQKLAHRGTRGAA